jgi:ABC-type molybdate transport system substrate-binding protein
MKTLILSSAAVLIAVFHIGCTTVVKEPATTTTTTETSTVRTPVAGATTETHTVRSY